jgi:hypothetical protein
VLPKESHGSAGSTVGRSWGLDWASGSGCCQAEGCATEMACSAALGAWALHEAGDEPDAGIGVRFDRVVDEREGGELR